MGQPQNKHKNVILYPGLPVLLVSLIYWLNINLRKNDKNDKLIKCGSCLYAQLARWVSDGVLQYSYVRVASLVCVVCGVMVGKEGYILSGPHSTHVVSRPSQTRRGLVVPVSQAQWCPGHRTAQISSQGYQWPALITGPAHPVTEQFMVQLNGIIINRRRLNEDKSWFFVHEVIRDFLSRHMM